MLLRLKHFEVVQKRPLLKRNALETNKTLFLLHGNSNLEPNRERVELRHTRRYEALTNKVQGNTVVLSKIDYYHHARLCQAFHALPWSCISGCISKMYILIFH